MGLYAIATKWKMSERTLMRLAGASGNQASSCHKSKRLQRLAILHKKVSYPEEHIELWLGRGCPLSCYVRGMLIDYLRSVFKPKDIDRIPSDYFFNEKVAVTWNIIFSI